MTIYMCQDPACSKKFSSEYEWTICPVCGGQAKKIPGQYFIADGYGGIRVYGD